MSDRRLPPALSRLLNKASEHHRTGDQLVFAGSLQDPIPRHLIVDPDLPATAVRIWAYLRSNIHENNASTGCPTYKDIMHCLSLGSKTTVSTNLALLRATRWLSVKEKTVDRRGYFSGSIYILHTEPVNVSEAIILDEEYMQILLKLLNHTNHKYHRLASELITVAEQLFDVTETSSLDLLDQRINASQAVKPEPESGKSMLGQFYQRSSKKKTKGVKIQSIVEKNRFSDNKNKTSVKIIHKETQKDGQSLASIEISPKTSKTGIQSQISGVKETKITLEQGGQSLATSENQPSPYYGPGSESNKWTPFCSSSSFNKLTTTNNNTNSLQKDNSGPDEINNDLSDYDFHNDYLKFNQNQKHLAQRTLLRIAPEYRQMVLDEVAARVKMVVEDVNPSQKPVGSSLAYVKWQCNEILNGRNALTGRHPDDIDGGESDRQRKSEQLENARLAREQSLANAHDERIAKLIKKQNKSSENELKPDK